MEMEDRKAAKVLEERIREEFKVSQHVGHLRAATNASSQVLVPISWLVLSALWEQKSYMSEQGGT